MHKKLKYTFTFLMLFLVQSATWAQCSMCKAVAESNVDGGGSMATGLNNGILYLMAIPYVLMATIAFLWYRNKKANSKVEM